MMSSKLMTNSLRRIMRQEAATQPVPEEEKKALFGSLESPIFHQVDLFAKDIQNKRIEQDKTEFLDEWNKLVQVCTNGDISNPQYQKTTGSACAELLDVAYMLKSMGRVADIPLFDSKLAAERSCNFGELHHCLPYEKMSGKKGVATPRIPEVTEKCKEGDADACFSIFAYTSATATTWDRSRKRAQAAPYLKRACMLGHPNACGLNFMEKNGDAESAKMISDCCLVKGTGACCQMAFENAMGVGQIEEAFKFAEPACKECSAPGPISPSFLLAVSYSGLAEQYGEEFITKPVDKKKAIDILTKACNECEDTQSCALLGSMTERGWGGLRRDKKLADLHYRRACENGFFMACVLSYEMKFNGKTSDLYSLE